MTAILESITNQMIRRKNDRDPAHFQPCYTTIAYYDDMYYNDFIVCVCDCQSNRTSKFATLMVYGIYSRAAPIPNFTDTSSTKYCY